MRVEITDPHFSLFWWEISWMVFTFLGQWFFTVSHSEHSLPYDKWLHILHAFAEHFPSGGKMWIMAFWCVKYSQVTNSCSLYLFSFTYAYSFFTYKWSRPIVNQSVSVTLCYGHLRPQLSRPKDSSLRPMGSVPLWPVGGDKPTGKSAAAKKICWVAGWWAKWPMAEIKAFCGCSTSQRNQDIMLLKKGQRGKNIITSWPLWLFRVQADLYIYIYSFFFLFMVSVLLSWPCDNLVKEGLFKAPNKSSMTFRSQMVSPLSHTQPPLGLSSSSSHPHQTHHHSTHCLWTLKKASCCSINTLLATDPEVDPQPNASIGEPGPAQPAVLHKCECPDKGRKCLGHNGLKAIPGKAVIFTSRAPPAAINLKKKKKQNCNNVVHFRQSCWLTW